MAFKDGQFRGKKLMSRIESVAARKIFYCLIQLIQQRRRSTLQITVSIHPAYFQCLQVLLMILSHHFPFPQK